MDDGARKQYFEKLDAARMPEDAVETGRKELARRQVEEGAFAEEDSLSMEEWEEAARVRTEKKLEGEEGTERVRREKEMEKATNRLRRKRSARREARREMELERERKKEGEDLES